MFNRNKQINPTLLEMQRLEESLNSDNRSKLVC